MQSSHSNFFVISSPTISSITFNGQLSDTHVKHDSTKTEYRQTSNIRHTLMILELWRYMSIVCFWLIFDTMFIYDRQEFLFNPRVLLRQKSISLMGSLRVPCKHSSRNGSINTVVPVGEFKTCSTEHGVLCQLRKFRWHLLHDDIIKWKHFLRYCPFVRGIHRSPERLMTRSFDVFFDLRPSKRLSK